MKAKNEIVIYKGVEYKVRTLKVKDNFEGIIVNHTIRIAPIELNEAYDDVKMSIHGSKEQKLDASIDHYVTKETIDTLPDVVTLRDVSESILELEEAEW